MHTTNAGEKAKALKAESPGVSQGLKGSEEAAKTLPEAGQNPVSRKAGQVRPLQKSKALNPWQGQKTSSLGDEEDQEFKEGQPVLWLLDDYLERER